MHTSLSTRQLRCPERFDCVLCPLRRLCLRQSAAGFYGRGCDTSIQLFV